MTSRGFTLIELLTASVISGIMILLIGQVDVTRIMMSNQARQNSTAGTDAGLAIGHMERMFRQADRIDLPSPTSIQFRRPSTVSGANLDLAGNYTWAQYQRVGTQLRFYDNTDPAAGGGCGIDGTFDGITALNIVYDDVEALVPPGGEPPVQDNNALGITVNTRFLTNITIRNGAYTNLPNGLAPPGVSNPPAAC